MRYDLIGYTWRLGVVGSNTADGQIPRAGLSMRE
jgi:hypothetical protein